MIETSKEIYVSENCGLHWELNKFNEEWKFEKLMFSPT